MVPVGRSDMMPVGMGDMVVPVGRGDTVPVGRGDMVRMCVTLVDMPPGRIVVRRLALCPVCPGVL